MVQQTKTLKAREPTVRAGAAKSSLLLRNGLLVTGILAILHFFSAPNWNNLSRSETTPFRRNTEEARAKSSALVQQKRNAFLEQCLVPNASLVEIEETLREWYKPPPAVSRQIEATPLPCNFTFLDFGANIGDSLGKLINAGIPACNNVQVPVARYNIEDGTIQVILNKKDASTKNPLTEWARNMMREMSKQVGRTLQPEEYCYYGVEGNPVFTERLKQFEARVLQSSPPPVRLAHFFTETIGTDTDGPATLYLDTVNHRENYWGSSIYASHQDVKKSATNDNNGEPVAVAVMGLTLTTLLRQTMAQTPGSHLMIKMDIEGAEYAVLNEAYDSGILCDYATSAVRVDLLVETHPLVNDKAAITRMLSHS